MSRPSNIRTILTIVSNTNIKYTIFSTAKGFGYKDGIGYGLKNQTYQYVIDYLIQEKGC